MANSEFLTFKACFAQLPEPSRPVFSISYFSFRLNSLNFAHSKNHAVT